jgi:hypothetical protein
MPGNLKSGLPPYQFATATDADCKTASRRAKFLATLYLNMKPKHVFWVEME